MPRISQAGTLYRPVKKDLSYKKDDEVVQSFTEPDVFIYRKNGVHSALFNKKGKPTFFKGGSTFKKHFVEPFEGDKVAANLASHWTGLYEKLKELKDAGLPTPKEILKQLTRMRKGIQKLWKDKGQSTSTFGNGLHRYRELVNLGEDPQEAIDMILRSVKDTRKRYMENLEIGEEIFKNKKSADENYAKPTHKDIRNMMKMSDEEIIDYINQMESEFQELDKSLGFHTIETLPEVYVTALDMIMGGEIDRLLIKDLDKKICRVQDYKVQGDLDEVDPNTKMINELAKKKATKLDVIVIQLSYYAYCLWRAGWTVEGGDVFGRDGEWEHYEIELIPMEEMDELLKKYL